jgi:hypothetical protein
VLRPQPTANARYVRRRPLPPTIDPLALLAQGGLCAQACSVPAEAPPRYEAIVVAAPEDARAHGLAGSSVIATDRAPMASFKRPPRSRPTPPRNFPPRRLDWF